METISEVFIRFESISNIIKIEEKQLKPCYNDEICTLMSKLIGTGALVVKNIYNGLHFISHSLKCIKCSKKFYFKLLWIDLDGRDLRVKVRSDNIICNHPDQQSTRPVKGIVRKSVAEMLVGKSTPSFINEKVLEIDENLVISKGNLQSVKSPSVLRKIRSERYSADDLDPDDIVDIHKMALTEENISSPFIQRVTTFPFTIIVR